MARGWGSYISFSSSSMSPVLPPSTWTAKRSSRTGRCLTRTGHTRTMRRLLASALILALMRLEMGGARRLRVLGGLLQGTLPLRLGVFFPPPLVVGARLHQGGGIFPAPSRRHRATALFRPPLVARKWSHEAAPVFAPPRQEPFAFRFFATPGVVKAAYVYAQRFISSSGATDHAFAARLVARGAPSSPRTPLLRRGRKRFPGGVAALAYRQLCKLLRVFLPPPTLMALQKRG